mmetsp:Transcript_35778/g.54806  ORF Transcript_35778/g.54806 Transcript_35778/m.54806 type:complete len:150 (-) Transcript_35778:785-1234(-)
MGHDYHKRATLTNNLKNYKNLTQGRDGNVVAAACLYMACRINNSPHLLIDFADAIKVDMFQIAKVFKLFSNHILLDEHKIPEIDPSLFIHKFCSKLEFGEDQKKVEDTSIRLIQSMNRSWMTIGRRPSGLCGAAIFISSKYHGFKRTIS